MNIKPSGTLKLVNVPILTNVESTKIQFLTQSAQSDYYTALTALSITSYEVIENNRLRVNYPSDQLSQYNYLFFSSAQYNNKNFYCKIIDLIGINSGTTDIYIELDNAQTFSYDGSKAKYFSVNPIAKMNDIYPDTVTVKAGYTLQFYVVFSDYKHISKLANYAISPATTGVSINSSGKLTVGSNVSTTDITVTASDRFGSDTVTATVHIVG